MLSGNPTHFYKVGEIVSFETGGFDYHSGEFIHTSCNGYSNKDHSVTARVGWEETRVFWYLLTDA